MKICPARFICEGFFYCFTEQVVETDLYGHSVDKMKIRNDAGFNFGRKHCMYGLIVWLAIWIVLSMVSIHLKYRKL